MDNCSIFAGLDVHSGADGVMKINFSPSKIGIPHQPSPKNIVNVTQVSLSLFCTRGLNIKGYSFK